MTLDRSLPTLDTDPQRPQIWQLRTQTLSLAPTPRIMGIVNVTPDSFSDGGSFFDTGAAVEHGLRLVEQGASLLDIGGESTRPYSESVAPETELSRVLPVVQELARQTTVPISIDTSKAMIARAAIDAGAEIINDVTGLEGDPQMLKTALETGAGVCVMHMQGTPQTMQDQPVYQHVVQDIHRYLEQRFRSLCEAGVDPEKICLDPGIGFGKSHAHNLQLLRECRQFLDLPCPILVGHSRKGMIGKLLGNADVERDSATLGVSLYLAMQGVQIIRVHEVEKTYRALRALQGILQPDSVQL